MKRTPILLAVLFFVFAVAEITQAQVRIAHLENNTTLATAETTVSHQVNIGNSTLIKVGSPTNISRATGTGIHGGTVSAASATTWSAVSSDPATSAATYYEFTIDTRGFTAASLSFDVLSGTTSANHPHIGALVSTDGGKSYSPLLAGFDPGNSNWVTQRVNLPAADNNSNLVIRIYGYHSDGTSDGMIVIDNLIVFDSPAVDSAKTKSSLNESDVSTVHENARDVTQNNQPDIERQEAARIVSLPTAQRQTIPLRSLGSPAMTRRFFSSLFADRSASSSRVADTKSISKLVGGIGTTEMAGQQAAAPAGSQIVTVQAKKVEGQPPVSLTPTEGRLVKAHSFDGDLRNLPYVKPVEMERPELEEPERVPVPYGSTPGKIVNPPAPSAPLPTPPAPAPIITFEGLDRVNWGAGIPPDTNGDVGPNHYIQTVNTSIGIYNKSTGALITALTFNNFMSQGAFGNICDTNNAGDPVVLYDSFEDRWVISDFAFIAQGNGANASPGAFQCIAVSKTENPVSGGWNFYSIRTDAGFGDYPKFGIWIDGLYMTANMYSYGSTPSFLKPQLFVFNKAQMYAASPTVQTAVFDIPATDFALVPSNARLQTGTPPVGTPNYVAVVWQFLNSVGVYKAQVNWNSISTSTLTGPTQVTDTFWWSQLASANQTSPTPINRLDQLYARLMMQNQYTNIGGVESLWAGQTAGNTNPTSNTTVTQASVRYYQLNVTGGTLAANTTQSFTYAPADTIWRYMPSVAVDRAGNMAIGYSTSNATTNPAIKYAGRLSTDAVNSITQTEQLMFQGAGTQSGTCNGTCTRWGDYSAMSLDPDGCTFWFTSEYQPANGLNWQTRIGSFKYTQCTSVGSGGTVSGTVTDAGNSSPISGATVALGARTTTTNGSGVYSFTSIPAGTYSSITASFAGYGSSTATTIAVTDSATTTRNFALTAAGTSACPVDTSQADFQTGVPANTDLTTSGGNVTLTNPGAVEQQSTTLSASGFAISTTTWYGQTFTAGVSGPLIKADINLFCSGCTGTSPNLTLSVRATSAGVPTGADLASTTLTGNASGAGSYFTGTFASPPSLTSGTVYALIVRPVSPPSAGTYAITTAFATTGSAYAGGTMVSSGNSGGAWSLVNNDAGFHTYINAYATSGTLISTAKDANPATGFTANWSTLSWTNVALPSGTTLKFQAAASNNVNGPFNFVGPDGTASTFFTTSGASLSQFNNFRYLKYEALLGTSNTANTPTLNDVTICYTSNNLLYSANGNLAAGTYNNITINSPAVVTETGNVTVNGCVTINTGGTLNTGTSILSGPGCFTLNSGATLGIGSANGITSGTTASGNIQVTGGRSYSTGGNYTYNGSAAQVTGNGLPATVNNLTLSNSAGLSLTADTTVNGVLGLSSGDITTGSRTVIMGVGAPASTGNGDVVGNVNRTDVGATLRTFGNPNVQITETAGSVSSITVNLVKGSTANDFTNSVKRIYTITPNNGTLTTATVRLHYLNSEVNSNPESSLVLWRKDVAGWNKPAGTTTRFDDGAPDANWVQLAGVTQFSPWTISDNDAPTDVAIMTFKATRYDKQVLLEWQTGYEVSNIGFNIYREKNGNLERVTPEPVAGSALIAGPRIELRAGLAYSWWDEEEIADCGSRNADCENRRYWIEDLDLSGGTTIRGPFGVSEPTPADQPRDRAVPGKHKSSLLSALGRDASLAQTAEAATVPLEPTAKVANLTPALMSIQSGVASQPAVKLSVQREGWYRVEQAELTAAGLPSDADPAMLQLLVDGKEVPIIVTDAATGVSGGKSTGQPSTQPSTWTGIEFYGIGINSPSTVNHVYWLVAGSQPGLRIAGSDAKGSSVAPSSFSYAVERRDKIVYFPALKNGGAEKWFGPLIFNAQPVDQSVMVQHIAASGGGLLLVSLQGFTDTAHSVRVLFNGVEAGTMRFTGLQKAAQKFVIPPGNIHEGVNQIQLIGPPGTTDLSMVDFVQLNYSHTNTADNNSLRMPAAGQQQVTIDGFTNSAIRVVDVTDSNSPVELKATVSSAASQKTATNSTYSVTVAAPNSGARALLAFASDQQKRPAQVAANQPSNYRDPNQRADYLIITRRDLLGSFGPLADLRKDQGLTPLVIDVEDIYDEFSFGNKTPQAVKDFLTYAKSSWARAPKFVVLAGDATYDPKNYLGSGDYDLVPTRLVETAVNEAATDDWFADVNGDSLPDTAIGRLPVRTPAEAAAMVTKLVGYDASAGTNNVLLVADRNSSFDFEAADTQLRSLIPGSLTVTDIRRGQLGDSDARSQLLAALNQGAKLVNFYGHGSTTVWTDAPILSSSDAAGLTNRDHLALVVSMTCLNGYFVTSSIESLGESLLKAQGGAIAVWASSGLTDPQSQTVMSRDAISRLLSGSSLTIGEVVALAKASITNVDVRRTWILLGDPATRLK